VISVHSRVSGARENLREAGLSPAEADLGARLLAEHVLGWDAARYFTSGGDPEPDGFATTYDALVLRRASREPLAYITGRQDFWDLTFEVSPDVLIPRPETELIVEAAIELLRERSADGSPLRIADACTGCGCLAVALARELPQAHVVATDVSEAALAVARRNAARHGVDARVRFVRADVLDGVAGPFDAIVANPPYVRAGDRPGLQPEVREHEPAVALFGGADGVDIVARLVAQTPAYLSAGGYLIFEFGYGQDVAVEQLIAAAPGLTMIGLRRDLQGIARTAVARRT
jgi:release factor glutamine methyltransferase